MQKRHWWKFEVANTMQMFAIQPLFRGFTVLSFLFFSLLLGCFMTCDKYLWDWVHVRKKIFAICWMFPTGLFFFSVGVTNIGYTNFLVFVIILTFANTVMMSLKV